MGWEENDGIEEEEGKGEVAWFNHSLFMSRILKLFVSDDLKIARMNAPFLLLLTNVR